MVYVVTELRSRRPQLERVAEGYRARFPWYADLQAAADPDLPLVDQQVLERHYYGADLLPDADVYLTSGTSGGTRKRIQYCASDDERYVAQRRDVFARFVGSALLARPGLAVADLGTGHAAALARRIFSDLGFAAHDIDFTAPLAEHVASLNELRPTVLFTMPMILDQMIQATPPLTARPRKIIIVGDLAPPAWRANVARRFGIRPEDVLDVVGSIEIGAIAYSDAVGGGWRFHQHILAEVLSEERRVSAAGDGVLLLTSSTRDYFPAVRYVTGDLVAGLRQDARGARCDRFLGRVTGDLKHGERISAYDLCEAVAIVFPGAPFEVSEGASLHIRVAAAEVTARQRDEVCRLLRVAAPDVAVLLDSGLVGSIRVSSISIDELRSGRGKRRFNVVDD